MSDPEPDHGLGARGETAAESAKPKDPQADREHALAPEEVPEPPARNQKRSQGEHVAADHPLEVRSRYAEVLRHLRQREVEREEVKLHEGDAQRRRNQCQLEPRFGRFGDSWSGGTG